MGDEVVIITGTAGAPVCQVARPCGKDSCGWDKVTHPQNDPVTTFWNVGDYREVALCGSIRGSG